MSLKRYYEIFVLLTENARISAPNIAHYFNHSGRGRSPSTFLRHILNMYKRKISKPPQIALKTFEECHVTAYFCTNESEEPLYDLLSKLDQDQNVTYAISLSSKDFFIVSWDDNLNLMEYSLTIIEKSTLYAPIYPIPKGWNLPMDQAFNNFRNTDFKKGLIPRTLYKGFGWDSLDWDIFQKVKKNIRSFSYTEVARKVDSTPTTVRTRFLEEIIPKCVQINYFFPKGYDAYWQVFLKIETDYESSIVKALEKLPCTSYIFPLEKDLVICLFYEDVNDVLLSLKKVKKEGIVENCSVYNLLACTV